MLPTNGFWEVEVTDTFAGEANYCWARRYELPPARNTSDRALIRQAKKIAGYTGVPGRTTSYGDSLEWRPYGVCHVMFITWRERLPEAAPIAGEEAAQ
jgi:hypothetical protein